jgi:hypothetical protein
MTSMDLPYDAKRQGKPVAAAPRASTKAVARPHLTWLTLAFMTTSSVASLRAAPTMAVYGLACVFLYLLPTALVSAELASGWDGGVYNWVSQGLGRTR